ncbi:MAG: hypothetical protein QM753_07475 [Thermomicrobiales bacterium]
MGTEADPDREAQLPAAEAVDGGGMAPCDAEMAGEAGACLDRGGGVCAPCPPLLANSHPLLMKSGGAWSSPLIRHLTAADVILLLVGFVGLPFLFWYRATGLAKSAWRS